MIAHLRGTLLFRDADGRLVIDVHGVGYLVTVGLAAFAQHAEGAEISCHVHTNVKEDEIALYGFESPVELRAFRQLLDVSGIGPKVAIQILTGLSPEALVAAIEASDAASIARAKGVGKRMAEKIIVELKGKIDLGVAAGLTPVARVGAPPASTVFADLRSALANLQYRQKEIDGVIAQLKDEQGDGPEPPLDALLRRALAHLRK
jgi:Holliday junction DNA helicase RuvA